jgi:hypothetical protein
MDGLEPNPYELLNDSIRSIATDEQIQALIEKDNLVFMFKLNLRTIETLNIQMDYFELNLIEGSTNLSTELITHLELFFLRNLQVKVKPMHSKKIKEGLIECAFLSQVYE